ncbi:unnamed protein product [Microthlaspi erraticum]|uniref:Uncharacterized protein n=1 Tax=Microthlaspi erraticum TaxID=1685480 RepID=A0A6D2I6G8_9BRAS|nr:unnamed protein product [Microthlaspi erraticum]
MTLFPTKFENGKIEYKIRYKGRSRPFSRAKALVTSEQSRDPTKLKELLSQVKGASSTDSSIELETRATRSSSSTRPRYFSEETVNKMTNSEGSRASQRRMVEGESSNARERRLKMQADLERMIRGWKSLMQRDMSTLRKSEKEGNGSPSEEGSDETESEEEGEEVNQLVDEMSKSNQDEPWRRLSQEQQEEDELPMYQEHYNALFSMDFMDTKYPHVDT